jgi:hypothetical protein
MLFDPATDSIEEVLAVRAKAKELLAQGLVVMEWGNEGTSARKAFGLPLRDLMQETLAFLRLADPQTYGRRVTRTRPGYTLI